MIWAWQTQVRLPKCTEGSHEWPDHTLKKNLLSTNDFLLEGLKSKSPTFLLGDCMPTYKVMSIVYTCTYDSIHGVIGLWTNLNSSVVAHPEWVVYGVVRQWLDKDLLLPMLTAGVGCINVLFNIMLLGHRAQISCGGHWYSPHQAGYKR